ncbi:MAG: glycosyltransferase family 2 protein [Arenimonas sp.]
MLYQDRFVSVNNSSPRIAVVIPCFRVSGQILSLLSSIGPEASWIFIIDDACPDGSGELVAQQPIDARITLLKHDINAGVGAAVCTGYAAALKTDADIIVKCDGDGQMDPALINALCAPVHAGLADYVKGNRFYRLRDITSMPMMRVIGNAALSFMCKLSSGYWQLFDPTNGFTAIHRNVLKEIPLDRVAKRYFFESDMLYYLNQSRAVVRELPMQARYGDETSSLNPFSQLFSFTFGHARNFMRRCIYSYFIRGFSLASIQFLLGIALCLFGVIFGSIHWWYSLHTGVTASAGTVMLAALPLLIGMQLLLSWLNFDIASEPRQVIHTTLHLTGQ